jgi:signal transduction histidine kinase
MKIFGYKNISNLIMSTIIIIILSNTLFISLFYYHNQQVALDNTLTQLKHDNINLQKQKLKTDLQSLVTMINYKYDNNSKVIQNNKTNIENWVKMLPFDIEKNSYIFVYALINKEGGDKFAKMIINPNRTDLVGNFVSSNYKDPNGFAFRKQFLKDINERGESFVQYSYKKSDTKIVNKISYFYYYEPLNWIIAKGIYLDDIQKDVNKEKMILTARIEQQIKQNLFFFLFFSIIAIIFAYIIGKKVQSIITQKDKSVKSKTKALANLNKTLDIKVKRAVEKNKEQEQILMQKSKFIAMGEMISLIAHQWRQPISELNAIILNIKIHYNLDKLDKNMLDKKTKDIENLLNYMSNTIDDFRTFFKPDKTKEKFYLSDSCQRVTDIASSMLNEHNISLIKNIDQDLSIHNYQNEFEQVVLNIITNAKDALLCDNIINPEIKIYLYKTDKIYLEISDNAKGIAPNIIDKIFEPYFTTKEESDGTGIGLYMSKLIIEENMGGELNVRSSSNGTYFIISFEA